MTFTYTISLRLFICFCLSTFIVLLFVQTSLADDDLKDKKLTKFQKDSTYIDTELEKAQSLTYSKPDSAEFIINTVIAYSKEEKNEIGLMRGYAMLGAVKFNQEELEKSKSYLDIALKLSEKLENDEAKTIIFNSLGNYYLKKSNTSKAIEYYLISIKIEEKQKDAELASSYINLGIVYKRLKNYKESENYLVKAGSAYSKNPEITKLYSYLNLAELYLETKNYERNLTMSDTIYMLATKVGMKPGIGASFTYKASSLYELKEYEEALTKIDSALTYFPRATPHRYKILLDKAKVLSKLKKYNQAETILLELLPPLENFWEKKAYALLYLSDVYKGKKQFDKSLEYFELHKVADDTLKSRELKNEVANLLVKYETGEKEIAIEKLNQEAKIKDLELRNSYFITISSVVLGFIILIAVWIFFRQKNIIDTFEKEQAKLRWRRAQLNPHFFFNVLTAIQTRVLEGEKQVANKYIGEFSYLMRQVLEGLNQEKVSLEEEIKFLTTYLDLEKLSLDFDYDIRIEPQDLEIEDIFIPTMLLQPFVENAIEHGLKKSNKENKNLNIKVTEINQNELQISVKDNGIGRNQERKKQHISRALEITADRQRLMKNEFTYQIIDHQENENSLGTEILFIIKI